MGVHSCQVIHSIKTCNSLHQHDHHNFPIRFIPHRLSKCWGILKSWGRDVRIYDILTVESQRGDNFRKSGYGPCGKFRWMKNLLFGPAGVILENKDVLEPGVGVIVKFSSGVPHSVNVGISERRNSISIFPWRSANISDPRRGVRRVVSRRAILCEKGIIIPGGGAIISSHI